MSWNLHLLGGSSLPFFSSSLSLSNGNSRSFRQSKRTAPFVSFWKRNESFGKDAVRLPRDTPPFKVNTDFMRFRKDEEFQTAVVSYRKPFPWSLLQPNLQVDLVAVTHLGEKEYYSSLQQLLATYDRVLYELVAEKDEELQESNSRVRWMPPEQMGKESYVKLLLWLMAMTTNLDFQIKCLDYRKNNWYHADLDYKTFNKLQREKGENIFTLARGELDEILAREYQLKDGKSVPKRLWKRTKPKIQNISGTKSPTVSEDNEPWKMKALRAFRNFPKPLVFRFLFEFICANPTASVAGSPEMKAFFRFDLAGVMRALLAKTIVLDPNDGTTDTMANSVIVGERNKVAMEELHRAIKDGCSRIAIFYGSDHMPDFDRRLRGEFQLIPSQRFWLTAWSIEGQRINNWKEIIKLVGSQAMALFLFSAVIATDLWFWQVTLDNIKEWAM
eukprot:TRINITY_DN27639_c0_g1_i1.p1 TRINITY_DN27639_c0_g1~~TRINITY_DN27639_c0_g1_i1.p1  ORF type:complete len:444 (-),score=54.89 TRINITY_DN27639_c0_g1_i1:67-1398(-)